MQPLLYNFNKPYKEILGELINIKNPEFSNLEQLDISPPYKQEDGSVLIKVTPLLSSPYTGVVDFVYKRLDIGFLFYGYPLMIRTSELTNNLVSNYLKDTFKINLEEDDFSLSSEEYFGDMYPVKYKLTVNPESYIWEGSIEFWCVPENHIGFTFEKFNSLNKPAGLSDKTNNGYLYSASNQFVEPSVQLKDFLVEGQLINTNDFVHTDLLTYLKDNTGDEWVINTIVSNFNLKGSLVVLNELVEEDSLERVIVLRLSPLCNNLFGLLVIHFVEQITENLED